MTNHTPCLHFTTEIVSAVMNISILMPLSKRSDLFQGNKIGKEHCSKLALNTIDAIPSVKNKLMDDTIVCTTLAVL